MFTLLVMSGKCAVRKEGNMETKTLSLPNISCEHCVNTVKKELSDIEGVSSVEGDAASKSITVEWDVPATLEKIKETLKDINYPAAE
jgi:copper chaperone CopZ